MPRRGENIRKRTDGRWEGRYIYERGTDGKAKYRSVYAKSYTEVKDALAVLKSNKPLENKKGRSVIETFGIVAKHWMEECEIRLKYSTVVKYTELLEKHILPVYSKVSIYMVTSENVAQFLKNKAETLSNSTIQSILTVIKAVLRYANKRGQVDAHILKINIPKKTERNVTALTVAECTRLEEYLINDMGLMELGNYLCLYTGLRIGELCALRWCDVDIACLSLRINSTLQRIKNPDRLSPAKTVIMISEPKSVSSKRQIPLPFPLVAILRRYVTGDNCFLLSGTEKPVEPRTVQYWFSKCAKKLNLSHSNFHCLRHTFATKCIEVGFDVKTLSEILGHSRVEITLNKYVHSSEERKRSQMALLYNGQGQTLSQIKTKGL